MGRFGKFGMFLHSPNQAFMQTVKPYIFEVRSINIHVHEITHGSCGLQLLKEILFCLGNYCIIPLGCLSIEVS